MPQGNHHYTPSGLWYQTPTSPTIPKLLLATVRGLSYVAVGVGLFNTFVYIAANHTYNSFKGRTMTLGNQTVATYEPASVEYIDKLKTEMEERRRKKYAEMSVSSQ